MSEWFDLSPVPPLAHQRTDTERLLQPLPAANFSEMGTGKTKTAIDAGCELFRRGKIDAVIVVCPAHVRGVWDNPELELGQLAAHAWGPRTVRRLNGADRNRTAAEMTEDIREATNGDGEKKLLWLVTSYDFLREGDRAARLTKALLSARVRYLLVLDESHYIKNKNAVRTKACRVLRKFAVRCLLMTGTPDANNVMDFWAQLNLLDPASIFNLNYWSFRARYAVMGGWKMKQVVGVCWENFEELQEHLKKWVILHKKEDCLDLPPKVYEISEVPLSKETWTHYEAVRDEFVSYIEEGTMTAQHAGAKAVRLAQLTSGIFAEDQEDGTTLERQISSEKQNALVDFLVANPEPAVLVWCRFRKEIEQTVARLRGTNALAGLDVVRVAGGQSDKQRQEAIATFERAPRVVLVGQPQAGGSGLNLTRAGIVCYLSNDFNLTNRLQSEDRAHRKGQTRSVLYVDFVATSPSGRHTVDHAVLKALRKKEEIAAWTVERWREIGKEI